MVIVCNTDNDNNKQEMGKKRNAIQMTDKTTNIKGNCVVIPQLTGNTSDIKDINESIRTKIESFIDCKSTLDDFGYTITRNDENYISIIIELLQYKEGLPHPGKQAHAINIDVKKGELLNNTHIIDDVNDFYDDIKNGKYILSSEINNNISYSSKYLNSQNRNELIEMFSDNGIEVFYTNHSLGFIIIVPYAIGNYAIFIKK